MAMNKPERGASVLEPEWRLGDVVKDARGVEYERGRWGWTQWPFVLDEPARPLALVTRDGKPVTP